MTQGEKGDQGDRQVRRVTPVTRDPQGEPGEAAGLPPGLSPEEILGILSADHVAVMVAEHSSEAYGGLDKLTGQESTVARTFFSEIGQEATVKAVVRTQDGAVVEGAVTWFGLLTRKMRTRSQLKIEVITALASNYNIDDAKYSASKVSLQVIFPSGCRASCR